MKTKTKKGTKLRHDPLATEMEKPVGKLRTSKPSKQDQVDSGDDIEMDVSTSQFLKKSGEVSEEDEENDSHSNIEKSDDDEGDLDSDFDDGLVEKSGEYVNSLEMTKEEENVVNNFLLTDVSEHRSLADIIMAKLREKEVVADEIPHDRDLDNEISIPPKVIEVYTAVGKLLQHYKSGKLPKALKMLPHLKNWEHILWLTRPDEWSPSATYAVTRIFSSNLNAKMAQRFFNLVLLEKCRDDIRINNKMNYHLYLALKKALFKPAAFYKGLLLPLAQSGTCTLREAAIIGSVLSKVSIPGNHSAAVLLRLAEMPYNGSTSLFIKILLNKKYALPRRVIEALVCHFCSFVNESRELPVIWHQSFLVFAQRYKLELNESQKERVKTILRCQQHHLITPEIRREILTHSEQDKY